MDLNTIEYYCTLAKKWHKTGLLEGLANEERLLTAYNLEMAAKFLIDKSQGSIIGDRSEEIAGIMLPCVRRFPEKIKEIGIESFCEWIYGMKEKYSTDYAKVSNVLNDKLPFNFDDWWITENVK